MKIVSQYFLVFVLFLLVSCANYTNGTLSEATRLNSQTGMLAFSVMCHDSVGRGRVGFVPQGSNSLFENLQGVFFNCTSSIFDETPKSQLLLFVLKPGKYRFDHFGLGNYDLYPLEKNKYFEFEIVPQKITYAGKFLMKQNYAQQALIKNINDASEDLPLIQKQLPAIKVDKRNVIFSF